MNRRLNDHKIKNEGLPVWIELERVRIIFLRIVNSVRWNGNDHSLLDVNSVERKVLGTQPFQSLKKKLYLCINAFNQFTQVILNQITSRPVNGDEEFH